MIDSDTHEKLSGAIADVDAVEVTTEDDLPDLETALDALATAVAAAGLIDEEMDLDGAVDALMTGYSLSRDAGAALADIRSFAKELKYIGGVAGAADELTRSRISSAQSCRAGPTLDLVKQMTKHIYRSVEGALQRHNISLNHIVSRADEVIVFGSYAAGLQVHHSDVDLLCIGDGRGGLHTSYFDLTCITREFVETLDWRQSELANHVAMYGVWLKGNGSWTCQVFIGEPTVARKVRLVANHIDVLEKRWSSLAERFRRSHLRAIHRNLQRLELMRLGKPVCPTALLPHESFDCTIGRAALATARQRLHFGHAMTSVPRL
jgi:predicted nucleotidyltransferase